MKLETLVTDGWADYALLDSGFGRKLERVGHLVLNRPEPQAMWTPRLPEQEWQKADAMFAGSDEDDDSVHGRWQVRNPHAEAWQSSYDALKFNGWLTKFHHIGYFPEQCAHWEWLSAHTKRDMKVLNLFAYSGIHSLVCAKAGAQVTHVDASKKAVQRAKENQELNDESWPIRWIVDDAAKFIEREVRRGNFYDGIVLDPPKFGRGPNNEVWDLFTDLPHVLEQCAQLLKPQAGSYLLLTSYAIRASALAFGQLAADKAKLPHALSVGELFVREQGDGRLLPTSMFTRMVLT